MLKKCQVVMLPTNEKAQIHKGILSGKLCIGNYPLSEVAQHLYFLSDEEIKEGDYIHHPLNGKIVYCDKKHFITLKGCSDETRYGYKKIIATTDSSIACIKDVLSIPQRKGLTNHYPTEKWILPQPSQSFLEVFVREYNKGNVIKEVLVEYEGQYRTNHDGEYIGLPIHNYRVKVNPKDNTITIKRVKDSFNLQEMEDALVKHYLDIGSTKGCNLGQDVRLWTKKWIEQNL